MSDTGDYLRKIQPGEKPRAIPREAYNAFVDAAIAHRKLDRSGEGRQSWHHEPGIITVRNSSGADVDRFGILEVSGALVEPEDNETEWERSVALDGTTPSDSEAPFCVLLEPLADGAIGRAVIAGACWVWVEMGCESHLACGPQETNSEALVSSNSGPARILYVEPGATNEARRAYVLLGSTVDGCNANGCGSPAWVRCRKRVIDVRCTAAGIEYDAEFDYYDCHGALLFTSDVPCPDDDGGTPAGGGGPVTVTIPDDLTCSGSCTPCDCAAIAGAYTFTQTSSTLWESADTFDMCGSTYEVSLYLSNGVWFLQLGIVVYENTTEGASWNGEAMTMELNATAGICTGWPTTLSITPA